MLDLKELKSGSVVYSHTPIFDYFWIILSKESDVRFKAISFSDWGKAEFSKIIMTNPELQLLKKERQAKIIPQASEVLFDAIFRDVD